MTREGLLRAVTAGLLALALALSAAGCGGTGNPEGAPSTDQSANNQTASAQAISREEAPEELRTWASQQAGAEKAAYKLLNKDGVFYLAVSGGMQKSGGYQVEVVDLVREGDGWKVITQVTPPPPGTMVTMALENPVSFYKLVGVTEPVTVEHSGPQPGASDPGAGKPAGGVTVDLSWREGDLLTISGTAVYPDLQFEVRRGQEVLGVADTQVKDGQFIANVIVMGGPQPGLTLVVTNVETGQVLTELPVPEAP